VSAYWHSDHTTPGFDPGILRPRDEDQADYDPHEDHDPDGYEADAAAARMYGR
jgi:hypothetical protein